ncbi:calcium-binding protein [Parazoarcus communis]|uniref:calcium-binding protein n=1 Tax=Parazoarcus communis TaxID=41977 RepID=UPI002006DC56|nr:calcium-binding protein [Parazoarcus communis]
MSHTAGPNDGVLQREDEDTNSAYENNSDISTVGTFYVTQDRLDDLKEYIRSESTKESNYGALGNSCYDFVDAALGKIGADKSLRDLLEGQPDTLGSVAWRMRDNMTNGDVGGPEDWLPGLENDIGDDDSWADFLDRLANEFLNLVLPDGLRPADRGSSTYFDAAHVGRVRELFNSAESQVSPIILDLDGNGVTTVSSAAGIHFDHDGNGFAERTGWVDVGDGLLVWDRNGNGVIDNGLELFGNQTLLGNGQQAANGFAALAQHDSNGNGAFDAYDALWSDIRVWRDLNQDGVSQAGELFTLAELGIASISLSYANSTVVDAYGNAHKQIGSFKWANGDTGQATDVWFGTDLADTRAANLIDVPQDIAVLPNLGGFGNVHSLHQAMARDDSGQLRGLVEQFVAESDPDVRNQLMTSILYAWAGALNVAASSRGTNIDARKLVVLESFLGEGFGQLGLGSNPGPQAGILLDKAFDLLSAGMYQKLMLGTHARGVTDQVQLVWDETGGFKLGFAKVVEYLVARYETHGKDAVDITRALVGWLSDIDGVVDTDMQTLERALQVAAPGLWVAYRQVMGTPLDGTAGDDTLRGGAGNDVLLGGEGNDYLAGGEGSDVYVLHKGAGSDTIYNYDLDGSIDTVRFLDVASDGLRGLNVIGNNLILLYGENDRVTIQSDFAGVNYQINRFEFTDRTLTRTELLAAYPLYLSEGAESVSLGSGAERVFAGGGNDRVSGGGGNDTLYGQAGDDTLSGDAGDDVLDGGVGNDVLHGGEGADTLYGGEGNDSLYGNAGNDVLDGGAGNDYLAGGEGSDVYVLHKGAGSDTIYNYDLDGSIDTVRFLDVASDGLRGLNVIGNNLILLYGENDRVTIQSDFAGVNYQINRFEFTDRTLTRTELLAAYPLYLSEGAESVSLGSGAERVFAGGGNDRVSGGGGNDTLYGQAGDDTLYGDAGDDVLDGGTGNDYLAGGVGNDTYLFGRGGGQDTIYDYDSTVGNTDRLVFGEDIAADQLWFSRSGSNLQVSVIGGTDRVTINNWYSGSAYRIETFHDGSGATLLHNQVDVLVQAMAAFSPPAAGETSLPGHYRQALDAVIAANWQ